MKEKAIDLIFDELRKAEAKFPGWPDKDVVHGAAIMAEEAGETVAASLDYYYGREKSIEKMIKETAQTGAMAIRLLVSLLQEKELTHED